MEDCLRLVTTKEAIKEILSKHEGKNYFQCEKCLSIKSDAKELARTLYAITVTSIDSGNDLSEEVSDQCNELLHEIIVIGMPEECYRDTEFCTKWVQENDERSMPELNDFEDEVFIKSHDVILKVDSACGCLLEK